MDKKQIRLADQLLKYLINHDEIIKHKWGCKCERCKMIPRYKAVMDDYLNDRE